MVTNFDRFAPAEQQTRELLDLNNESLGSIVKQLILSASELRLIPKLKEILSVVKNLDSAPAATQLKVENILTEYLNCADQAIVYIGRDRFIKLGINEARAFQFERQMDQNLLEDKLLDAPRLSDNSVIFIGSANNRLGQRVLSELGVSQGQVLLDKFPNSESQIQINESVRDKQAFLLINMEKPVNESLVETCLMVQALKLAGAHKITVILPYFAYSRQDRRADIRPPIGAKAVTDMLKVMGATQIISVDLHARQVEGFFDGPFDNLDGINHFVRPIMEAEGEDLVVVSPDAGGSKRAERFARMIETEASIYTPLIIMSKFRKELGEAPSVTLTVDSEYLVGKTCILVDDMIDTGGSMIAAASELKARGAKRVILCATHGIFSNNAIIKLREAKCLRQGAEVSAIDRIYTSDTISLEAARSDFLQVISLSPLIAEAIYRLDQSKESLRELNMRSDLGRQLPVYLKQ